MNQFLFNRSIRLCLVLALVMTCAVRAENPLETQDQALAWALENHPDIVAAKAKVALTNAELYGKRVEVSRQVLGLYGNMKKLDAQVDASRAILKQLKQPTAKGGTVDQASKDKLVAETQAAETRLARSIGEREQVERELRLLVGTVPPPVNGNSAAEAVAVPSHMPRGPIIDKMTVALEKPLKLDFAETPLQDVMGYLTDKVGITFSLQKMALDNAGIGTDQPITLRTSEVPLHAVLEAFQDAYPDLQFYLRDYGVLVTTKESAEEHGYMPVLGIGEATGVER